jgi:WD40 repeat protein
MSLPRLLSHPRNTWGLSRRVLEGINSPVRSLAISPDGSCIASRCDLTTSDGLYLTQIWRVSTGEILYELPGVKDAVWSPSGGQIAAVWGSSSTVIRIWDSGSGIILCERRMYEHPNEFRQIGEDEISLDVSQLFNYICKLAHSPDGTQLAFISGNGAMATWNLSTDEMFHFPSIHTTSGITLTYSLSGLYIASTSMDRDIALWCVRSGELLWHISTHNYTVQTLAFGAEDNVIVGCAQGSVHVWNTTTSESVSRTFPNTHDLSVSRDGTHFITIQDDWLRFLELYEISSKSCKLDLSSQVVGWMTAAAISPNVSIIASGGFDGTIHVWDVMTAIEEAMVAGSEEYIGRLDSAGFSADGSLVFAYAANLHIKTWNVSTGALTLSFEPRRKFKHALLSPNNARIVSWDESWTAQVYDAAHGERLFVIWQDDSSYCKTVAISADSAYIGVGSTTGTVQLVCMSNGKKERQFTTQGESVHDVVFSPNGRQVAALTARNLWVWNTQLGTLVTKFDASEGIASPITFTADGRHLVTCSVLLNGEMLVWDVERDYQESFVYGTVPSKITNAFPDTGSYQNHICGPYLTVVDGIDGGDYHPELFENGTKNHVDCRIQLFGNSVVKRTRKSWPIVWSIPDSTDQHEKESGVYS